MTPDPAQIRQARLSAGLSQAQAAALVGLGHAHRWSEYERGIHACPYATWRLFRILTGQDKCES
jgi:transcriptional regulator with XRE-family HTH domain